MSNPVSSYRPVRIVGATVLTIFSVSLAVESGSVLALVFLPAAAATGAALMWIGMRKRAFYGYPATKSQSTVVASVGAALAVSVSALLRQIGGDAGLSLGLATLLAGFVGVLAAVLASSHADRFVGPDT